jgi:hypothetical protein
MAVDCLGPGPRTADVSVSSHVDSIQRGECACKQRGAQSVLLRNPPNGDLGNRGVEAGVYAKVAARRAIFFQYGGTFAA